MRFLLVDTIVSLTPGAEIAAEKIVSSREDLFQDHFPGFPVVPGVLLTEMMAQTAGKCLNAQRRPRGLAMLVEIRNARFRRWVRPDEIITLQATIIGDTEAVARAQCSAAVAGATAATCELVFSFMPREQFSAEYRDDVLDSFLSRSATAT